MLNRLMKLQKQYNKRLRGPSPIKEVWTAQYLLGITSEIDECLDAIQWKRHRKQTGRPPDLFNLTHELGDILKYILSICEIFDITTEDLVLAAIRKSEFLEQQWKQEFEEIPSDRPILITDIDGTLGDWRAAFILWCKDQGKLAEIEDPTTSLLIDTDLAIKYPNYAQLKEDFERGGGYRHIIPYPDAVAALAELQSSANPFVIAVTARPVGQYSRIWYDSWFWLMDHGFQVDQLRMVAESRILLADQLNKSREVILWEDDPGLICRAATSGFRVFGRRHKYNEHISRKNFPTVQLVDKYTDLPTQTYFS